MISAARSVIAFRPRSAEALFDSPPVMPPRSKLPGVCLGAGVGLAVQASAYAVAREGRATMGLTGFYLGLIIVFVPAAWALVARDTRRGERAAAGTLLGVMLLLSSYLRSPLLFDRFDELLHQRTLWQLEADGFGGSNPLLPVSPFYPALELMTLGITKLSGAPLLISQLITLTIARAMLMLALFVIIERAARSHRAAGAGLLVVASSPQFYLFLGQYSYQTLALPVGLAILWLTAPVETGSTTRLRWSALLAGLVALLTFTHHLTSWLFAGVFTARWLGLREVRRRRSQRVVAAVAAASVVMAAVWLALVHGRIVGYLGPVFSDGFDQLTSVVRGRDAARRLGADPTGLATPLWERAVMAGSIVAWCVILGMAVVSHRRDRSVLGWRIDGAHRRALVLISIAYPLLILARFAPTSAEIADRSSTFVFIAMGIVLGRWFNGLRRGSALPVGVATIVFVGGVLLGSGPDWQRVPGPYMVSADSRSVDDSTLGAARWASSHLPRGTKVAADRVQGALMSAVGDVDPVTALAGGVNVGPLYFARTFGPAEVALVERGQIRVVVVDARLAEGLPHVGVYFEPGETTEVAQLPAEGLAKFATIPGAREIYHVGPIRMYDVSAVWNQPPLALSEHSPPGKVSPNWMLMAMTAVVAWRWARRVHTTIEGTLMALVVAALIGVSWGTLAVLLERHIGSIPLRLIVVAAAVTAWCRAPRAERPRGQVRWSRPPVALGALLVAAAVAVATWSAVTRDRDEASGRRVDASVVTFDGGSSRGSSQP